MNLSQSFMLSHVKIPEVLIVYINTQRNVLQLKEGAKDLKRLWEIKTI